MAATHLQPLNRLMKQDVKSPGKDVEEGVGEGKNRPTGQRRQMPEAQPDVRRNAKGLIHCIQANQQQSQTMTVNRLQRQKRRRGSGWCVQRSKLHQQNSLRLAVGLKQAQSLTARQRQEEVNL